ncbi:hypothetical protein BKA62DRAFT_774710 [Auriculariales sp. MPI-PUGE-AT-0066]|nr:hypothetical protein BKA62DRAFT_774710 [Auriculariales sp. MPI-PUGE-AT-0066]
MSMPEPAPDPAHAVWKALGQDPISSSLQVDSEKPAENMSSRKLLIGHNVCPSRDSRCVYVPEVEESSDAERLEQEMAYWGFVELHPAHVDLSKSNAPQEALEALNWSYTDRLMTPTFTGPAGSPYGTRCQELKSVLRELIATGSPKASVILTRIVAKVHLRPCSVEA